MSMSPINFTTIPCLVDVNDDSMCDISSSIISVHQRRHQIFPFSCLIAFTASLMSTSSRVWVWEFEEHITTNINEWKTSTFYFFFLISLCCIVKSLCTNKYILSSTFCLQFFFPSSSTNSTKRRFFVAGSTPSSLSLRYITRWTLSVNI